MRALVGCAGAVLFLAGAAAAGYQVVGVQRVELAGLEGRGQVQDPRPSPDGRHLAFEFLGAAGDSLDVYLAAVSADSPGVLAAPPAPVLERRPDAGVFALGGTAAQPVAEQLSWGPPKRGKPRFVLAATRREARGGSGQVNFDLFLSEPGRRRYLTDHPDNDAQPAFSPDGEFVAFASGRTGQGDLYLYHFYAQADPLVQVTFEPVGSELFPAWAAGGDRLAYTAHLGGEDHVQVVDGVRRLAAETDPARRRSLARTATRDLVPGWRVSCLAPSFSPDGQWVAFYAREGSGERADLYVVPVAGGEPRKLLAGGIPETRGGPRWAADGRGLFAVLEDGERMNPLVWVPVAGEPGPQVLATGTQLNADPFPGSDAAGAPLLWFTAQGSDVGGEKRWRGVYAARLREVRQ